MDESEMLQKVANMEKQIAEVKSMYQKRMYEIEPSYTEDDSALEPDLLLKDITLPSPTPRSQKSSHSCESNIYPSITAYPSTPTLAKYDAKRKLYGDTNCLSDSTETLQL